MYQLNSNSITLTIIQHLDGGLFSVNIALNSYENDFEGGGTFLERLISNDYGNDVIQRPCGAGHALIHSSTERHAGAPTTGGIRDILVFFLTTRQGSKATGIERGHRLKALINKSPIHVRMNCLKMAIEENPFDGEAFMWLGFYGMCGNGMNSSSIERLNELNASIENLKKAASLSPCCSRVRYFLGKALDARVKLCAEVSVDQEFDAKREKEDAIKQFERCLDIEAEYKRAGCTNDIDEAGVLLRIGDLKQQLGNKT